MEMGELVLALAPEGAPSRRLFSLLVRSLGCLCYDEEDPFKIGLHFQIRAMACSGYGARLSTCAVCWDEVGRDASFSPADGGALCFKCASPIGLPPVSAGALKMLGNISTYDPDRLHVLNIPQELRADMKSLWQDYMRYHLNRHFRSPEFSKRLERFHITLNHKK
jgi:DNA repair protein RecO (recombination protein O)